MTEWKTCGKCTLYLKAYNCNLGQRCFLIKAEAEARIKALEAELAGLRGRDFAPDEIARVKRGR